MLLENLSKVTSHDSLTHLNNNTLTQPLKLSKILFFRKYKIQSMHRISLIWYSIFHFKAKLHLKAKISHKEQEAQQPDIFAPDVGVMSSSAPLAPNYTQFPPNKLKYFNFLLEYFQYLCSVLIHGCQSTAHSK